MGMFDELTCKYPLPVDGFQDRIWQTKDTPAQFLDRYEIREDGSLWHEEYDVEDRSKAAKWMADNHGKPAPDFGLDSLIGCMTRVNKRWVRDSSTGSINFYSFINEDFDVNDNDQDGGWIEFRATLESGAVQKIEVVENRQPANKEKQ